MAPSAPSAWDTSVRAPSHRYLNVSGLRVRYTGPGSDDRDAAAVRANHPVPVSEPVFYWEAEIVSKGRDGFIGIGFSTLDVKQDRLPGWEPRSYGYHGDDGHIFGGRGTGQKYGPFFTTGDTIGVILNRVEQTISFTKNGYDLGVAFHNVTEENLYPTVGFRTPDEEIEANFGQSPAAAPFKHDISGVLSAVRQRLRAEVLQTALPSACQSGSRPGLDPVAALVFDYCVHHGRWESARLVARDALGGRAGVSEKQVQDQRALEAMQTLVVDRRIAAARDAAEQLAPGVLAANPSLAFKLDCQHLAELIAEGRDAEAMAFGHERLDRPAAGEDRQAFEDALALFAYPDPMASPCAYQLQEPHRRALAGALLRAVLEKKGRRERSSLQILLAQATALHEELARRGDPAAKLVDVQSFLSD